MDIYTLCTVLQTALMQTGGWIIIDYVGILMRRLHALEIHVETKRVLLSNYSTNE